MSGIFWTWHVSRFLRRFPWSFFVSFKCPPYSLLSVEMTSSKCNPSLECTLIMCMRRYIYSFQPVRPSLLTSIKESLLRSLLWQSPNLLALSSVINLTNRRQMSQSSLLEFKEKCRMLRTQFLNHFPLRHVYFSICKQTKTSAKQYWKASYLSGFHLMSPVTLECVMTEKGSI